MFLILNNWSDFKNVEGDTLVDDTHSIELDYVKRGKLGKNGRWSSKSAIHVDVLSFR